MMKTLAFIGSDKNAGKTTVFNFVYQKMHAADTMVCLTSIGINGEPVDTYEGHPKPKITVYKDSFFITAGEHLKPHTGKYETVHLFLPPHFSKPYVLAKSLVDLDLVLEGPNTQRGLMEMKGLIGKVLPLCLLLVDGSIDRQFLAHPAVCDGFYFAVLVSDRKQQLIKANDLLSALALPVYPKDLRGAIEEFQRDETKSLLWGDSPRLIYHGRQIPFLDETLRETVKRRKGDECVLYLNGALSKSLFKTDGGARQFHPLPERFGGCRLGKILSPKALPLSSRDSQKHFSERGRGESPQQAGNPPPHPRIQSVS